MTQLQRQLSPLATAIVELSPQDAAELYAETQSIVAEYWKEITQGGTGDTALEKARDLVATVG